MLLAASSSLVLSLLPICKEMALPADIFRTRHRTDQSRFHHFIMNVMQHVRVASFKL